MIQHIAIIMDGNRRWAELKGVSSGEGHIKGYKALKNLLTYCSDELKLPVLTVYAFSTENWGRADSEVGFLLELFHQTLLAETPEMIEKNIRLKFLGNRQAFSPEFQVAWHEAEALTAKNTGLVFQVALNYGGRAEVIAACKQIAEAKLEPEEITDAVFESYLYSAGTVDPDMIIRTGGTYRLSNFLLWQSAYSEICVVEELWPDFTPEVLNRTIAEFQNRHRRFGK